MKVLVVEDESKLADYLHKGLSEHGFVVDVARNGFDGLHLAVEGDYDVLILDIMLPGIDGLAVLGAVRKTKGIPVLMLTTRDRVEDRVRGLQEGADDYLVKPLPSRSCSPVFERCIGAAARCRPSRTCCASPIWRWTCCVERPSARGSGRR